MLRICPKLSCSMRKECEYAEIHDHQDNRQHCCEAENNDCPRCAHVVIDLNCIDLE